MNVTKGMLSMGCGLLLMACAGEQAGEEAVEADTLAVEAAPAGIALADVVGSWNVRVMNEAGDSVSGHRLDASTDPAAWTIHFPGRDPVPVRNVRVEGDVIRAEAGPFESSIRPGVMVSTENVYRLEGDRLVSEITAHYETTEPDSVLNLRSEGTRAP